MRERSIIIVFILLLSFEGYALGFNCPTNQFLYDDCSTCFSLEKPRTFQEAEQFCKSGGGNLISIQNYSHLARLERYLEGLKETRSFWVGYRYSSEGERVSLEGDPAPDVIREDGNFNLTTATSNQQVDVGTCIGIRKGTFFNSGCSNSLPFLCAYNYTVILAETNPIQGIVYVGAGSNFTLSANFPGTGITGVEWKLGAQTVTPTSNTRGIAETSQRSVGFGSQELQVSLSLVTFEPASDGGVYTLVVDSASWRMTVAMWQVKEAVLGPLDFQPENLTVLVDQVAGFECHASSATPPPQVTWFKDSFEITLGSDDDRVFISNQTGTLLIREVTDSDEGTYHCQLSNIAGVLVSKRAVLTVISSLPSQSQDLPYLILPRNQTVAAGHSFTMECIGQLSSTFSGTLTRYSTQRTYHTIVSFRYPENQGFPVLNIPNVSVVDDNTMYLCEYDSIPIADNRNTAVAQLNVYVPPAIDHIRTNQNGIEYPSSFRSIPRGSDLTLHCQFDVWPPLGVVEWHHNGAVMESVSVASTRENLTSLNLVNIQQSGVYQCRIINKYGRDLASVHVCVEEEDGTPGVVSFQAEPDTNSSIYIEWNGATSNTDPLLLRYEIIIYGPLEMGVVPGPTPALRLELLWERRNVVVSGLEANSMYEVVMIASSLEARGQDTRMTVTTFANVPMVPIPSGDIMAGYTEDSLMIVVEWAPFVASGNTPYPQARYQVEYRQVGADGGVVSVNEGMDALVFVIEVPSDGRNYEVRVRVSIQVGRNPVQYSFGPWSDYVLVEGLATTPTTPTTTPVVGVTRGIRATPMGLLLIYVLVPVGVVLLVVVFICSIIIVSCWYRKKPEGVYSIADTTDRSRKRNTFNSSHSPQPHHTHTDPSITTDTTTALDHTHTIVTVSIVDTSSVERAPPPSDSWMEEFDQLENLVSTLNDTVISMATLPTSSPTKNPKNYDDIPVIITNNVGFRDNSYTPSLEDIADIARHEVTTSTHHHHQHGSTSTTTEGEGEGGEGEEKKSEYYLPAGRTSHDEDDEEDDDDIKGNMGGSHASIIKENLGVVADMNMQLIGIKQQEGRGGGGGSIRYNSSSNMTGSRSSMSTTELMVDNMEGVGLEMEGEEEFPLFHGSDMWSSGQQGTDEVRGQENLREPVVFGDRADLTEY